MPDWRPDLRQRLSGLRLRSEREAEIVEELSQHLDDRFHELLRDGMEESEARRLALDEVDEHELLQREMRPLRQASVGDPPVPHAPRGRWTADLKLDLRFAGRMLIKQPGFAAAVILTLGLGIGANTTIFSLISATLLQRLPAANTETLVYAYNGQPGNVFSYPAYLAMRDGSTTLERYAAWGGITASLNADGETDLVSGVIVTGNFFDTLGVSPGRGRLLGTADDATVEGHPVAVISDRLWKRRFGSRSDILGREILLNGQVFTVVGVTRPEFVGPVLGTIRDLYVPMMMQAVMRPPRAGYSGEMNPDLLRNPRNGWLNTVGRLRPGSTPDRVSAELGALVTNFVRSSDPNAKPRLVPVEAVDDANATERQRMRAVAWLLGGVVGAVLLIACANVANLLLSRATARRREIAVRLAIGASRRRVVTQLLTESVLLATLGGAVGLGLTWVAVRVFQALPPPAGALPVAIDFVIDARVLGFCGLLSLATGIAFGLLPALAASRASLIPALKDGAVDGRREWLGLGAKQALVVAQVAMSLVLLVAAGLFLRSLRAAYAIDPGIDATRLISAPLNINLLRYTRTQGRDFYQNAVERVSTLPGVESAALARVAVFAGGGRTLSFLVEGRSGPDARFTSEGGPADAGNRDAIRANVVDAGFFETLGIARVSGRNFDSRDTETSARVVILNASAARLHFNGVDPVGKRVSFDGVQGPWVEVIGTVRDSDYAALGEPPAPVAYLPLSQNHETGMVLYVRTAVPPETLVAAVQGQLRSLEPNLALPDVQPVTLTIGTSLYAARMGAGLLAAFGALALVLASIGLHGLLTFSMARRTRELGIRMALGASRRDVFGLVVREGMTLVAVGISIGLACGWLATRSLATFLYGIPTNDLLTFAIATLALMAVAVFACMIPARRATRVDPLIAIRYD